jgi:hypothetical protein
LLRDASGNFTAGTITAAVTGAASSNVLKAGDTMTGALVVPLASEATPSLTFTGDLDTGVFSPGANQLALATNGVERVEFGTSEVVFNDGGANYDFRIEGDTNTSLFFVDASAEAVGIGTTVANSKLSIGNGVSTDDGLTITFTGDNSTLARFYASTSTGEVSIGGIAASYFPTFYAAGNEQARIDTSGRLLVGTPTARAGYACGNNFTPALQR